MANNFSRSLALTALQINDTINALPAWEFMNQTGTLGTNLRGSLIYVGGTAAASNVCVIPAGTPGLIDSVVALTLISAGSGYVQANDVNTTYTSIVPTSIGPKTASALTVNITVPVPTATLVAGQGGDVYTADFAFTSTVAPVGGTGLIGTIASISGGGATGPALTLTITESGSGYNLDDVITITSPGSSNSAQFTITGDLDGEVFVAALNAGGEGYAVGDIITIDQAGNTDNATCRVDAVRNFTPTRLADSVIFSKVAVGSVLPIYVDYVLATGTTATLLVAGRESSIG